MYALDPVWEAFYNELDPEKRKRMFREITESQGESDLTAFRGMVMEKRYTDPKEPGRKWDLFLQQCALLPSLYRKRKSMFVNTKREIDRTLNALLVVDPADCTEEQKGVLYQEYKNAAKRYFKTCSGSKYGASFLGLAKADHDRQVKLAAVDAWEMSEGIASYGHVEAEMALFCEAVKDAFIESFDNAEEIYHERNILSRS